MNAVNVKLSSTVVQGLNYFQEHFDSVYGSLYVLENYIMSVENESVPPSETLEALRCIRKIRSVIEPLDASL